MTLTSQMTYTHVCRVGSLLHRVLTVAVEHGRDEVVMVEVPTRVTSSAMVCYAGSSVVAARMPAVESLDQVVGELLSTLPVEVTNPDEEVLYALGKQPDTSVLVIVESLLEGVGKTTWTLSYDPGSRVRLRRSAR